MEGPTLGPGGEDITWPDQVAPRGRKASSTRKIKPQTSNPMTLYKDDRLSWLSAHLAFEATHWAHAEREQLPRRTGSQAMPKAPRRI